MGNGNNLKVLMFGWEFPPHISGGLGTACYGLTTGLLKNDLDISFVVPKAFGDEEKKSFRLINASDVKLTKKTPYEETLRKNFTYFGIDSAIVPYTTEEEFYEYTRTLNSEIHQKYELTEEKPSFAFTGKYGKNLINEVWNYSVVAAELAGKTDHDIIHVHDWLTIPAGIMAKKTSGKPLVVQIHATEVDRTGQNVNQQVFDIERSGMLAADKVVAVSEYTRQLIINKYGIDPNKIVTIHNAADADLAPEEDAPEKRIFKEKIVSFIGRITYQKGPDYFVEAARKVLEKDKNYRFVMAGKGDMVEKLMQKVAEYRLSSHFHFAGFLKNGEVNKMLAMSDVYVMPSVSEPFGISTLEAVRANVPVIVSKQSGVTEVLHHAIKIDFWDTDAMANAIYALTKFKGLSTMFVREGKKEMENLRWETQARKFKELYQQMI